MAMAVRFLAALLFGAAAKKPDGVILGSNGYRGKLLASQNI